MSRFNNFLLYATDRSKISSDQKRLFFVHFSRTLPLKNVPILYSQLLMMTPFLKKSLIIFLLIISIAHLFFCLIPNKSKEYIVEALKCFEVYLVVNKLVYSFKLEHLWTMDSYLHFGNYIQIQMKIKQRKN